MLRDTAVPLVDAGSLDRGVVATPWPLQPQLTDWGGWVNDWKMQWADWFAGKKK